MTTPNQKPTKFPKPDELRESLMNGAYSKIDQQRAIKALTFYYNLVKFPVPEFIFAKDPIDAQLIFQKRKLAEQDKKDYQYDTIASAASDHHFSVYLKYVQAHPEFEDYVASGMMGGLVDEQQSVQDQIVVPLQTAIRNAATEGLFFEKINSFQTERDLGSNPAFIGAASFVNLFNDLDESHAPYLELIESGVFNTLLTPTTCIIIPFPSKIRLNAAKQLHGEEESAVEWASGRKLYFHRGMLVKEQWVMDPDSVTREEIVGETNAERRRAIHEIIGNERFLKQMDFEVIETLTYEVNVPNYYRWEDIPVDVPVERIEEMNNLGVLGDIYPDARKVVNGFDKKKQVHTLYRTKEKDKVVGDYLYFVGVNCSSTGRKYILGIPPEIAKKGVKECVPWTFGLTSETYKPLIES